MIKRILASLGVSAVAVATLGTVAGATTATQAAAPTQSIVQIAQSNGHFSTLLAAVSCAAPAIGQTLTSGKQVTVFAPTDAAFAKLNLNAGNVCGAFSQAQLTNILLYHVVNGHRDASSIVPRRWFGIRPVWTLLHQPFFVNHKAQIWTTSGSTANIVIPNIEATNGVVHVIDSVLVPAS